METSRFRNEVVYENKEGLCCSSRRLIGHQEALADDRIWPLVARTISAELSALWASGDQELASGVTRSSDVLETAAGRKPRAIIQIASTISCTPRGMNNKVCSVELVPMTAYIASR